MTDEQTNILLRELPAEALHQGQLRDGIRERLERLQQAPHPRLANLLDVREIAGRHYLAWQAIDGKSLGEDLSDDDLYRTLREMIDAIEGLHQLGLVHGNLRPENVILAQNGVYLTDASALLWTDEQKDIEAAAKIVADILGRRGVDIRGENLRSLRAMAAFLDGGYLPDLSGSVSENRWQRGTLAWAVLLLLLGIGFAAAVAWYFHHGAPRMLQS